MEKLSAKEFNTLNKIATKSKMDCWFYIMESKGEDVIMDLETGERLSLYEGINQLADGMTSINDYELTEQEKLCFVILMYKLEVSQNTKQSKYKTFLYNALALLEDIWGDMYLLDELGMAEDDYYDVVGEPYSNVFCEPEEEEEDAQ